MLFVLNLDRRVGGGQVKKSSLNGRVSGGPRASTQEAQLGLRTKADMGVTGQFMEAAMRAGHTIESSPLPEALQLC